MVVNGVSDVLMLSAEQIKPAPDFSATFDTEYITVLGTVDERMLILVDIEKSMTGGNMALMEQATLQ
jgi:purine-binding chemotaxis protein CheW